MSSVTSTCLPGSRLRCFGAGIPTPQRVFMAVTLNFRTFPFYPHPILDISRSPLVAFAKKKNSRPEPVLKPSIIDEVSVDGDEEDDDIEDDIFLEGFEDDELVEEDGYFEDEYFAEEAEPFVGDGAGGGGISLAGTAWDKKALEIAEEVIISFDGELGIYAFKTLLNAAIQVRIERLTNKSGSPSMTDIEAFSTTYRARLDEAETTGSVPENISLEVSSPGVERVVRIPQDLERFKDRNLYVKYATEAVDGGSSSEHDGVFRLISFDSEGSSCTWGLADVRVNREKSGKGRPLSKKQKEWRLNTPLDSLRLVRLYSEI
ncbi:UNVERIFIED_CONTAM: Ribosome maturation factor RimP [Sesamum calycinum]|uniref:Ribosome maturation factor RimP n=1 Tax=Sesamum calycinum TaxID=2727403 RepID=A0AAW2P7Q3_9LAMI